MTSLKALRQADRRGNERIAKQLKKAPIAEGVKGSAVKAMEKMLKLAGYDVGTVDDTFDAKTARALKNFQAASGNVADGAFDAADFKSLKGIQSNVRAHHGKDFIGVGQAGAKVKAAEQRLQKLGYDVGAKDGRFDAQLAKAVAAFKKDEGIKGDAQFLGNASLKALRQQSAALEHAPYRSRITRDKKEHRRLDAATAKGAAAAEGLGEGANRKLVANVQKHLRAAGFDPSRSDGVFDERTKGVLTAFQKKAGLEATGRVDAKTWKKLDQLRFEAKDGTSPAQRLGEKSASVENSEKILRQLGYKKVKVDGIFDKATQAASRAFEKKYPGMGKDGAITKGQLKRMRQVLAAKKHPGKGPTLKAGYRGAPVKTLEKKLKKMGFDPGKVDGKFDAKTKKAVRKFQRAFALQADGVVGKKTWRMLAVKGKGRVITPGGSSTAKGRKLAAAARVAAMGLGGYTSLGKCATGVSRAISSAFGFFVGGNGNQIDNNLPRSRFKQVHMSLAQALKTPGLVLTWEKTSTSLGSIYGHTAITAGDGHTSMSDFIETNTLAGSAGRSGLKIFKPI